MEVHKKPLTKWIFRGAALYLAFKLGQTQGCYQEFKEDVVKDYSTIEEVIKNEYHRIKDFYEEHQQKYDRLDQD